LGEEIGNLTYRGGGVPPHYPQQMAQEGWLYPTAKAEGEYATFYYKEEKKKRGIERDTIRGRGLGSHFFILQSERK